MSVKITALRPLPAQFTLLIMAGFILTPVAGLGSAVLFGLLEPRSLEIALAKGLLPMVLALLVTWTAIHFSRYIGPFVAWLEHHSDSNASPVHLHKRLARFTRQYWGMYLVYGLLTPTLLVYSISAWPMNSAQLFTFSHLVALQLAVATLVGLPAYLWSLDHLGQFVGQLGLTSVQLSLKSRIMLLVGLVPLLCYSMLMQFHWLTYGSLSPQLFVIWAALAIVTVTVTVLSIRSMAQALRPVQNLLRRSGASTRNELAELRPQSTDEIGYMTQALGKLFRRLGDQESQMRAVVETAAEGIIVVDKHGNIDTFNPAAEQLFGYLANELQGHHLSSLLPNLCETGQPPAVSYQEQEMSGLHRNGQPVPTSVRVSDMRISGRPMYTCLVADITKRRSAETKLQNAEARYEDLMETAHDLVWSMDPQGRWTYLNRACKAIYGRGPEEMIGRSMEDFQSPDHAEQDAAAMLEILQGAELVQYETVHLDRDGNTRYLSFNARAHLDGEGNVTHISGTARDITERKAFEHKLTYQAQHDSLTKLFNRHYFQQELERAVARVARNGGGCALFYIDLDQFKYVNDTLGHGSGDRLLIEISELIGSHARDGDLLARFGGDEFTLLVYDIEAGDVYAAAEHFRELFERYRFIEESKVFNITASIGVAIIDRNVTSADDVLSHADLACNMAKAQGRNRINLYNPADKDKAGMAEDMGWAARVREMLENDRFKLVYQPVISVTTGQVQDYEVLVRMVCDDGEIILPGGFMPAAERFGLIHAVDRWIVHKAMRQLAELRAQGNEICFSINLSGKAFEDKSLLPMVKDELRETGLNPAWITFEITETAAIANLAAAKEFIGALKDMGCLFALDDFGSGFCSFSYLKHLPVDKLKIDGSFVQGLATASVDQAMVESMNQVAHALGKKTIAEYVENEETLRLLKSYGVDYAQGFYIGRPRDALINLARPEFAVDQSGVA